MQLESASIGGSLLTSLTTLQIATSIARWRANAGTETSCARFFGDNCRGLVNAWCCQRTARTPEGLERSRRANWKHGHYSREAKAERSRLRAAICVLRDLCDSI